MYLSVKILAEVGDLIFICILFQIFTNYVQIFSSNTIYNRERKNIKIDGCIWIYNQQIRYGVLLL